MTPGPVDWTRIRLAVFDVDGTLYDQRALRRRMLLDLARHTITSRSLETAKVLYQFRRLREAIAEEELDGFQATLMERTAQKAGVGASSVRNLVSEWIDQRPLVHIRRCRYPDVEKVFAALRRRGKTIGIFSDYPAASKLHALELSADLIVSATDSTMDVLKPAPRGLIRLMAAAGVTPAETIMIGDRAERDGEAALRAGVACLLRSDRPLSGWTCFSTYRDACFLPLLTA